LTFIAHLFITKLRRKFVAETKNPGAAPLVKSSVSLAEFIYAVIKFYNIKQFYRSAAAKTQALPLSQPKVLRRRCPDSEEKRSKQIVANAAPIDFTSAGKEQHQPDEYKCPAKRTPAWKCILRNLSPL
jgi:hypothetical protein